MDLKRKKLGVGRQVSGQPSKAIEPTNQSSVCFYVCERKRYSELREGGGVEWIGEKGT